MGTYAVELLIIAINLSCWALLHHLCFIHHDSDKNDDENGKEEEEEEKDGKEKENEKVEADKLALWQT